MRFARRVKACQQLRILAPTVSAAKKHSYANEQKEKAAHQKVNDFQAGPIQP
jgi:hypothetical protein